MLKVIDSGKTEELAVAGILDEFSYRIFKPDCNLIYLNPLNYKHILATKKVHLLFVESVWEGIDRQWNGIYGGRDLSKIERLKVIVKYCKARHIPTVFWNKEDPLHFGRFIDIACLFDFVFTTDEACIEKYAKLLGHNRVYVLPFAAQPAIHNPVDRNAERKGEIAFAGSWHRYGHMRRRYDMDIILKPAFKYGLSIYDRNYFRRSKAFIYPEEYKPYIKGGLPYNEIVKIYKKYDIFLNVNSVQNSPTMFSRRVFELLACGTNVISGYAAGIENLFSDIVPLCKTEDDAEYFLYNLLNDSELRDRLSLLGQREIFRHHTSMHRLTYVLRKIGLKYITQAQHGVSIIAWIDNHKDLNYILENYSRQIYNKKEIIIIVRKSIKMIETIRNDNGIKVLLSDEYNSLGECFDSAVNSTSYKYISFFNPRSYYGPDFIGDLINVFQYAIADIVGKHTYYIYTKDSKSLYIARPGNEYRFSNSINPHAMLMDKSILEDVVFTYGSEDALIGRIKVDNSLKMYSSDRFNYVFEPESIAEVKSYHSSNSLLDSEIIKIDSPPDYKTVVTV